MADHKRRRVGTPPPEDEEDALSESESVEIVNAGDDDGTAPAVFVCRR